MEREKYRPSKIDLHANLSVLRFVCAPAKHASGEIAHGLGIVDQYAQHKLPSLKTARTNTPSTLNMRAPVRQRGYGSLSAFPLISPLTHVVFQNLVSWQKSTRKTSSIATGRLLIRKNHGVQRQISRLICGGRQNDHPEPTARRRVPVFGVSKHNLDAADQIKMPEVCSSDLLCQLGGWSGERGWQHRGGTKSANNQPTNQPTNQPDIRRFSKTETAKKEAREI